LASGNGTPDAPWSLAFALSGAGGALHAGDTLLLRGGTYLGKYLASLSGVTVRSAPGEWAVIDGFRITTLAAAITATQTSITVVDSGGLKPASALVIEDEWISVQTVTGNVLGVVRGQGGKLKAPHTAGTLVVHGGNQLQVTGSDNTFRDFEIRNSDPVRTQVPPDAQSAPRLRGEGIFQLGSRNKFVNLVIRDCQDGLFDAHGVDTEFYGCLVFNNGYVAGGTYNGHGGYYENQAGLKKIRDCLFWNNCSMGTKAVGQTGNTINLLFDGCVFWNNGSERGLPGQRHRGLLVGANNGVCDQVTVRDCLTYAPPGCNGAGITMGFSGQNGACVVTGNRCYGGTETIALANWASFQVTGNRLAITERAVGNNSNLGLVFLQRGAAPVSEVWEGTAYRNATVGDRKAYSYTIAGLRSFAEWKADHPSFDAAATYQAGPLTGAEVIVQPNAYEAGRAHVIIYNWDSARTVNADLSGIGLTNGQRYEVRNVQNYDAPPVFTGIWDSAKPVVAIPMTDAGLTFPVGFEAAAMTTCLPRFGVFVVSPAAAPCP